MGMYFQDDFWEACIELPKKDREAAIAGIVSFYFTNEEPDLKGASKAVFIAFRERINIARKKSEAGKSKQNQTNNQNEIKTPIKTTSNCQSNENQNEVCSIKEGEEEGDIYKKKPSKEGKKENRFSPPSIEEVRSYCKENGYDIDAEQFVDFYASKGWKIGKSPMKDWKASVRTWVRRTTPKEVEHDFSRFD